jgi:hemerythrin superfamily protein
MNALEILKQDHQKVKQLFEATTHTSDQNKRKELFDKIDTELEIHAHIEETVFYPALEEHEELKQMVAEALEGHEEVKTLLAEIEDLGSESHDFGASFRN